MDTIPDEIAWRSEAWTLDTAYAYEQFFGRSAADAEAMFHRNALRHHEALLSMPSAPRSFYLMAYARYILSDRSARDSDGASCFVHTVEYLSHQRLLRLSDAPALVASALRRLATAQTFFDADEETYGSFRDRVDALQTA